MERRAIVRPGGNRALKVFVVSPYPGLSTLLLLAMLGSLTSPALSQSISFRTLFHVVNHYPLTGKAGGAAITAAALPPPAFCRPLLFPAFDPRKLPLSNSMATAAPCATSSHAEQHACREPDGTISRSFIPVQHPSFDLVSTQFVAEYDTHVSDYVHRQSGARVVSLSVPETETEKAFMVAFRTPNDDATGTPHILEHSVLMGSERYPVKEPFVALIKSSLYTYMNALTYPDRTCYPVASVNLKDFYNLTSVYMDAVFKPNALKDHLIFRQEGWRYELTPKDVAVSAAESKSGSHQKQLEEHEKLLAVCRADPSSCDLKIQGVVLNEMKGAYSSPDSLASRFSQEALFPDIPAYNLDSGGDPKKIPALTFEQFKRFYVTRYYPGNAHIYFWGADDVSRRLDFVANYLRNVPEREAANTRIGFQKQLSEPLFVERSYPASLHKMEDYVSVSWVLDPVKPGREPEMLPSGERMALQVLSHLLVGTTASPLYKALTESGLGKSIFGSGLSLDLHHGVFSAGLKGIPQKPGMVKAVEDIIFNCLNSLADKGFTRDAIEATLNTVEFALRELNTGTFPKGLSIILSMATESNYERDPVASVAFEKALNDVRKRYEAGEPIFETLIRQYILNNPHCVTCKLTADSEMESREKAKEKEMLEHIHKSLTSEQVDEILEDQRALKKRQLEDDSEAAAKSLPSLSLADLDDTDQEIPFSVTFIAQAPVVRHELPSSGIVYCELLLSLADMSLRDLQLLKLFSRMLTETGTSDLSSVQLQHLIGQMTGGISASADIRSISESPRTVADPFSSLGFLVVSGKALKERTTELLCLMHKVLTDANLGASSRAIEIVKEALAATDLSIQSSGHRTGARRILAAQTATGYVNEIRSGVEYRTFLIELLEQAQNDWPSIERQLYEIQSRLLRRENLVVNLTGDGAALKTVAEGTQGGDALRSFIEALSAGEQSVAAGAAAEANLLTSEFRARGFDREPLWVREIRDKGFIGKGVRDALLIPTKVNYVCQGGRLAKPGTPLRGQDFVVAASVGSHHLWKQVREIGGAYGSGFAFDASGVFCFTSYRDPQLLKTLDAYRHTPKFLQDWADSMNDEDVTRAILVVLRDIDAPLPTDRKGTKSLWQLFSRQTAEDRSRFRHEVLSTIPADFLAFATTLENVMASKAGQNFAIVGSEEACSEAQKKKSGLDLHQLHVFSTKSVADSTAR